MRFLIERLVQQMSNCRDEGIGAEQSLVTHLGHGLLGAGVVLCLKASTVLAQSSNPGRSLKASLGLSHLSPQWLSHSRFFSE